MDKSEAIKTCAKWWEQQFRRGIWDNGDTKTELMHRAFSSMSPKLTESDFQIIREVVEEWLVENPDYYHKLYFDYGGPIDDKLKARGSKASTLLHGPQKTGTRIKPHGDGFVIKAKSGYGGAWFIIDDDGEHLPDCELGLFELHDGIYRRWKGDKDDGAPIYETREALVCTCALKTRQAETSRS